MTFKLTRGETLSLALEAAEFLNGASLAGATCVATVSRAHNGGAPGADVPPVAAFAVVPVAQVVAGGGPGWLLTVAAALTDAFEPGMYVTRIKVTLASGFVEIVDMQRVIVANG